MNKVLIIGGVHGLEPQSAFVAEKLAKHFKLEEKRIARTENLFKLYQGDINELKSLTVIPDLNRSGLENNTRGNGRGVDLNRNMPATNWSPNYTNQVYFPGTHPSSELETKELVKIIEEGNFDLIISIHTNHFVANPNPPQVNFDGKLLSAGHKEAGRLAELLELPLTEDIGYPTPGSLGSYCKDKNIPCITLEMDDLYNNETSWAKYGHMLMHFLTE